MGGGVGRSLSACLPTWRGPRAAPRVLSCSCPEKTDLCLRGQVRQVLARREPRSGQVRGGLPSSSLGSLLLLQVDQILTYLCLQPAASQVSTCPWLHPRALLSAGSPRARSCLWRSWRWCGSGTSRSGQQGLLLAPHDQRQVGGYPISRFFVAH